MDMRSVKHQVQIQEWKKRVLEQQASGLNIKRWCAEQHIGESKYYYWLHNLRGKELAVQQSEPIFAELPVTNRETASIPPASAGICAVIRSHDLCLEIYNGANPQTLAATMRALGVLRQ
ncbi:MAG: hypothetical protein VB070_10615 [Clostridiaceae bacterium]|nr:hypothetical protein [Clostridiaceae bacterium]